MILSAIRLIIPQVQEIEPMISPVETRCILIRATFIFSTIITHFICFHVLIVENLIRSLVVFERSWGQMWGFVFVVDDSPCLGDDLESVLGEFLVPYPRSPEVVDFGHSVPISLEELQGANG